MLTEHFVASVGAVVKAPGPGIPKDASIFHYEYQPLCQQRQILKKSATAPHCFAISSTHIFAAQVDKGVVQVYGREKGNQEATVPFTEKISSITLACDDLVLVLGTVEGRIFLWEIGTGRLVSTPQSHLQAVTTLTVDPSQNFLLSGSKDSTINVWSLPSLLSFSRTSDPAPLRTFSSHRNEITSLVAGHSSSSCNFAISVSRDQTALVWDYRTGNVLRTYLLPNIPLSLDLDPADRAAYVGYEDGTLQMLDLYATSTGQKKAAQNRQNATEPIQPPPSSKWRLPESKHGAVLSLCVSFDGSIVLSGHQSGSVLSWDVARGRFASVLTTIDLPGPVNNLVFLPVFGFAREKAVPNVKIVEVVKPRFGAFDSAASGDVPGNYALNVAFPSELPLQESQAHLSTALTAPSFPASLIDEGLAELASWGKRTGDVHDDGENSADEDYMALDDTPDSSLSLQAENANLKQQIEALRRVQKKTFERMDSLSEERNRLLKEARGHLRGRSSKLNGTTNKRAEEEDSSD